MFILVDEHFNVINPDVNGLQRKAETPVEGEQVKVTTPSKREKGSQILSNRSLSTIEGGVRRSKENAHLTMSNQNLKSQARLEEFKLNLGRIQKEGLEPSESEGAKNPKAQNIMEIKLQSTSPNYSINQQINQLVKDTFKKDFSQEFSTFLMEPNFLHRESISYSRRNSSQNSTRQINLKPEVDQFEMIGQKMGMTGQVQPAAACQIRQLQHQTLTAPMRASPHIHVSIQKKINSYAQRAQSMFQMANKQGQAAPASHWSQPGMLTRLLNTRTQTMRRFSTRGQTPGGQARCVTSLAQRRLSKQRATSIQNQ